MTSGAPYNINLRSSAGVPVNLTLTFNINLRISVENVPPIASPDVNVVRSPMRSQWYNRRNRSRSTDSMIEIDALPVNFEDKTVKRDNSESSRRRGSSVKPRSSSKTSKSAATSRRSLSSASNSSSSGTAGSTSGTTSRTSTHRATTSVRTARIPESSLEK